jgi:hypothetical protein
LPRWKKEFRELPLLLQSQCKTKFGTFDDG